MNFKLMSDYKPRGDQPDAIEQLSRGIEAGEKHQVLLGVIGSGKTFTAAKVIERANRPILVLTHNNSLAKGIVVSGTQSGTEEMNVTLTSNHNTSTHYAGTISKRSQVAHLADDAHISWRLFTRSFSRDLNSLDLAKPRDPNRAEALPSTLYSSPVTPEWVSPRSSGSVSRMSEPNQIHRLPAFDFPPNPCG
jgi:hypothetical protein